MYVSFPFNGHHLRMKLRWNSSDFRAFEQVFIHEEYLQLLHKNFTAPIIVDGGANIGCTAIYLKSSYPESRIVAIEADEGNFDLLKENILLCGFSNVECINCAIWFAEGEVSFGNNYRDGREWSRKVLDSGNMKIRSLTMRAILQSIGVSHADIIKLDVEGAEVAIFANDQSLLQVLKEASHLAIEVHEDEQKIVEKVLNSAGFSYQMNRETLFAGRN